MSAHVLLALSFLILPVSLAAQQYTLKGDRVAVFNLVGQATITAGSGSDVTVTVTPGGAQAGRLRVAQGLVRDRETLRVIYPDADIVYPTLGRNNNTELHVRDDGTFDQQDGRDRRVRISGSGRGTDVHADVAIGVPAGRSVAVHVGAGKVNATNVNGSLAIDASSADVQVSGGQGSLSVDVGSGTVDVTGAPGNISIDTGSGDVSLDLAEAPLELSIDTGSGDITMRLPASTGARLSLETSGGQIETDFAVSLTRTGSDELNGTIGDGRGRIAVETGSGDVHLKKR